MIGMNTRWVIQNNLIFDKDLEAMKKALTESEIDFELVDVIPFSKEIPEFTIDDKVNIYYGSTTLMENIYEIYNKPIGLFYNHESFSMENYIKQWGEYMLNCDAKILTINEFINQHSTELDEDIFIRPDGDGKEFAGEIIKRGAAIQWFEKVVALDKRLSLDSKILVGPAYRINKEWRNYIVDGKIVTSSLYREEFRLKKSATDIPESMLEFVRERIKEYAPHDCFAIDIASTHDGSYYIIECGCLNSVGFYSCDVDKLLKAMNNYMLKVNVE